MTGLIIIQTSDLWETHALGSLVEKWSVLATVRFGNSVVGDECHLRFECFLVMKWYLGKMRQKRETETEVDGFDGGNYRLYGAVRLLCSRK